VRLWVCSTDYRGEMTVSNEILDRMSDAYRRIRNTARYLLSAINDFDPARHMVAPGDMLALDRWAVDCALHTQKTVQEAYDGYQFHTVYQTVHHFCSIDMSSFYLDIVKDRQYTMPADSLGRRSTQTAMYLITDALVRWIAPVLSFTADEIWQHLREQSDTDRSTRSTTIFTETYLEGLYPLDADAVFSAREWQVLTQVREAVSKTLETLRNASEIGSSLDASVTVYADESLSQSLLKLGDELRFVFITSTAGVRPLHDAPADSPRFTSQGQDFAVQANKAGGSKCVRCWHVREDVGSDAEHPEVCLRCVSNVHGTGEQRAIA
jgi:isoleucyl-tRNA synthetase